MLLIVGLANAQNTTPTAPPPTILSFTAELPEDTLRTVSAMENGDIEITLSWVISTGDPTLYRPELSTYRLREWRTIDDEDEDQIYWPFIGTRTLDLQHPLTFSEPTYRLQIVNNNTAEIVDERIITVPYDILPDEAPTIESFSVLGAGFDNQIQVAWSVSDRLPTANLIFEQLLDDGSAVNIELPRPTLWIDSQGQGMLAPQLRDGTQTVTLQLSIVDVLTQEVYDTTTITETMTRQNTVVQAPTPVTDPVRPGPTAVPPTIAPQNCDVSHDVSPTAGYPGDGCNNYTDPVTGERISFGGIDLNNWTPEPGGTITLSWNVYGADVVAVEMYNLGNLSQRGQVFNERPLTGSVALSIPQDYEAGIRIILWAVTKADDDSYQYRAYEIIDLATPFDASEPIDIDTDIAYQAFEHGFMIWTGYDNQIWAFTNGGQVYFYPSGTYSALPDNPITDEPPADRVKPTSGFGRVWGNFETVRETLGWAIGGEQGYHAIVQYYYPDDSYLVHHLIPLPGGRRIEARASGIWEEATR